jgi:hypothetical protein
VESISLCGAEGPQGIDLEANQLIAERLREYATLLQAGSLLGSVINIRVLPA